MSLFKNLFGRKDEEKAPTPPPAPVKAATAPKPPDDWQDQGTPQEMQPLEVQRLLDGPNPPLLLDVREPHELTASGWIAGSLNVPMSQIQQRVEEVPRDRPIVVYCAHGVRSFDVGFFLIEQGYKDVSSMSGGITAWRGAIERA